MSLFFCSRRHLARKRRPVDWLARFLALLAFPALAAGALEWTTLQEALTSGEPTTEEWAETMRLLGDDLRREDVERALLARPDFPKQSLVGLLSHGELAVRIGAIEWLESAAGADHAFDPWLVPGGPAHDEALRQWQAWAEGGAEVNAREPVLTEETASKYIRLLLSDQRDKQEHALRLLRPFDMEPVRLLETFLQAQPDMPAGPAARLRLAQYRLVLDTLTPKEAPELARRLALGSRDQQLAALGRLKALGMKTMPIVNEFVDSPDSLVRETAVDVFLSVGRDRALEILAGPLKAEMDANVIHAAIRQITDLKSATSRSLLEFFAANPEEAVVIEALFALKESGGAEPATISKALVDPRWRVRVAGLELVAKQAGAGSFQSTVLALLKDEDDFVRAAAVTALTRVIPASGRGTGVFGFGRSSRAGEKDLDAVKQQLRELFSRDVTLTAPIVSNFLEWETPIPEPMQAALMEREAELLLPLFDSMSASESSFALLAKLTAHPSADVRVEAYRHIAMLLPTDDNKRRRAGVNLDRYQTTLIEGMRARDPAIRSAIIQNLELALTDTERQAARRLLRRAPEGDAANAVAGTALDPLYEAFLRPMAPGAAAEPASSTGDDAGMGDLHIFADYRRPIARIFEEILATSPDETEKFHAALKLFPAGNGKAFAYLRDSLDQRPVSDRVNIAEAMRNHLHPRLLPMLQRLLRDPVAEVREKAVYAACFDERAPAAIRLALDELDRPGSPLRPIDFHNYSLQRAVKEDSSGMLLNWAKAAAEDPSRDQDIHVLALIMMSWRYAMEHRNVIAALLESESPWVRRAAIAAFARSDPMQLYVPMTKLVNDPSSKVRAAAAAALVGVDRYWLHYFNDAESDNDVASYQRNPSQARPRPPHAVIQMIEALMLDPADEVRLEASFALLELNQPIDLRTFVTLVYAQPEAANAPARVASFVEKHYRRLGPEFSPLLVFVTPKRVASREYDLIQSRFQGRDAVLTSFAAFAALDSPIKPVAASAPAAMTPASASEARTNDGTQAFEVIYFYNPNCPDCAVVRDELEKIREHVFPNMMLLEKSIRRQENVLLNQALCLRQNVSGKLHHVTPAVFTETGHAIREQARDLAYLNRIVTEAGMAPAPALNWWVLSETQRQSASHALAGQLRSLNPGIVMAAGLLDGLNPCAFATIIFFLSYLQVARRSRREILLVGSAFVFSVFLTYLTIGLVLNEVIAQIEHFSWARLLLNATFAAFAFVIMVLSFRDGLRARRGQLADMTLQLPAVLKDRIRGVIRTGARSSHFVIAALVSGIIISLLELACTGQVYAPIIYAIRQGESRGFLYLLVYNLAFILPLVIVFLLAYGGMRSDALIKFQKKHTAGVKFATAGLFLFLFLFLVVNL